MLTVDYDDLGLRAGDLVLDMGAGAGRHAFECFRRGAQVVALDYAYAELGEVRGLFGAMREAGEAPPDGLGAARQRRRPPPAVPRRHLRPHHLLRGHRAHPRRRAARSPSCTRVLKPGGMLAVTVPAWLPEKVCWALSDEYHAPLADGGHVRIYTEAAAAPPAARRRPAPRRLAPRPRAALAVLVAEVRRRPHQRRPPAGQGVPPAPGLGHREGAGAHPHHRAAAQPGARQEPRGLLPQAGPSDPLRGSVHRDRTPRARATPRSTSRRPRATGASGLVSESLFVDVAELVTARQLPATVDAIAEWQLPTRHDPVVPGRPRRPVEPHRGGHGARRSAATARPPSGPTTGCVASSAPTAPGTSTTWPTASSRTSSTPTCVAYVAAGVWHHWLLPATAASSRRCGRWSSRPSTSCSTCRRPAARSSGPATPTARRGRFALLTGSSSHLPQPALRHRHRRAARPRAPRLGARRRPPRPRHPRRARRLRPQAPLGDGLVLPGARRRDDRRRRAGPASPHRFDTFIDRRPGRALRRRTARGSPRPRPASACSPTWPSASTRPPQRAVRVGPALRAPTTAATGPASSYPDEVHFPGDEQSTYTAAAVVLAADALGGVTATADLFTSHDALPAVD